MTPAELPEGLFHQGDYIVSAQPSGRFGRIWTAKRTNVALSLTGAQFRQMATEAPYATARTGRQGWNVRKTVPTRDIERGLPFLYMDTAGVVWTFFHRGSTVVLETAK